jgi:hypothetical protein
VLVVKGDQFVVPVQHLHNGNEKKVLVLKSVLLKETAMGMAQPSGSMTVERLCKSDVEENMNIFLGPDFWLFCFQS